YPNPAIDHLTIESEEKIESYIIYSLNGVVVKQSSDFIDNKLQIGNLTSGCYFFVARTLRGNILKKFIVR
ncbi:MAG: T9SS type A sorting domain-containing protein, partial [Ulvibacter sp.]|nr:T9SS type A sorting domain-containing protein [Ulvibacter sp.]